MTWRLGGPVIALLGLFGCQPLPHPFADDRPPAALLHVRDMASVAVAPIVGEPEAVTSKLGDAVAKAFLKHEIVASERTTSLDSYQLYGRVAAKPQGGSVKVTALWRLYDAKGRTVGERSTDLAASPEEWQAGKAAPIERLAALSADALAPLLVDEAPATTKAAEPPPSETRVKIAVRQIKGAPGDGAEALGHAVAAVLQRADLAIVDAGQKPDLLVDCEVEVAPIKAGKQHVKITWHVKRPDGAEIGTVGQENDVPKGLVDGAWGDLAFTVALAAGEGLLQLVARGAPPAKS